MDQTKNIASHKENGGYYLRRNGEYVAGPFETAPEAHAWRDGYYTAMREKQ